MLHICIYTCKAPGIPFILTFGWFEHMGKEAYRHSEELLRTMIRDGFASFQPEGLPLHVWLTSPACEVLDVTLPTTMAAAGAEELSGGIIYISNRQPEPPVIYHPTVLGVEFLDKIGATVAFGAVRR